MVAISGFCASGTDIHSPHRVSGPETTSWDRVKALAAMRRPGRVKRRRTGSAALLARQIRGLAGRLRGAHEPCCRLWLTPESMRPHTRSPGPKHRNLRRSSFALLFRANEVTHRRRRRWRSPFLQRPSLRRLIVSGQRRPAGNWPTIFGQTGNRRPGLIARAAAAGPHPASLAASGSSCAQRGGTGTATARRVGTERVMTRQATGAASTRCGRRGRRRQHRGGQGRYVPAHAPRSSRAAARRDHHQPTPG